MIFSLIMDLMTDSDGKIQDSRAWVLHLIWVVGLHCYGAGKPRHDPIRIPRALGVNVEKSPTLQLDASCYCSAPD
jgi:hypothetical protein